MKLLGLLIASIITTLPAIAQKLVLKPELYERYNYEVRLETEVSIDHRQSNVRDTKESSEFYSTFGFIPTHKKNSNWVIDLEVDDFAFNLETPNRRIDYHMKKPVHNEFMERIHKQIKKDLKKKISFTVHQNNRLRHPIPLSKTDSLLGIPRLSIIPSLFDSGFIPFPNNEKSVNEGWTIKKVLETDFGEMTHEYSLSLEKSKSSLEVAHFNITGRITPTHPKVQVEGGFRGVWLVHRSTGMTVKLKMKQSSIFVYPNALIYHQSTLTIHAKNP